MLFSLDPSYRFFLSLSTKNSVALLRFPAEISVVFDIPMHFSQVMISDAQSRLLPIAISFEAASILVDTLVCGHLHCLFAEHLFLLHESFILRLIYASNASFPSIFGRSFELLSISISLIRRNHQSFSIPTSVSQSIEKHYSITRTQYSSSTFSLHLVTFA